MTFSRGVMFSFTGLNLPADGSVYIQICPDTGHRNGLIKLSVMATGRPSGVLPMPGCPGRIQAMEWRTGGRGVGDLRSGRWWQDRGGGLGANQGTLAPSLRSSQGGVDSRGAGSASTVQGVGRGSMMDGFDRWSGGAPNAG